MVANKPIDFRKGRDSVAALVKNALHKDPFTGTVFVFRARKTDRLKLGYRMASDRSWLTSGWKRTGSSASSMPSRPIYEV